ncbi:alpha/beta fold hydrolase [Paraferrimonas haliotis]|uniref:Alpha/beta hydrolase n=1 Tax=Paraferrimonas haliotis TaxID=2013866 RepID=A0AA37TS40_9GAMM|nr:alpha/beta fold hydrolase [Paraferrimonas haliotis]GLS82059.1 alpha/beta hydrolase [Paraferrimonas haliotis]
MIAAKELDAFIDQLDQQTFESFDGLQIAYATYMQENAKANIVISSGRIESYLKYDETLFNLAKQGYNLFIYDQRGQGLSQRLTDNPHIGHVEHFDHYLIDLKLFLHRIVKNKSSLPNLLLCHSMGGAIGLAYTIKHPQDFVAIAASAPMLKIKLPAPESLLKGLAKALNIWDRRNMAQPGYVLGGGGYEPEAFDFNHLTRSPERYARFRQWYQQVPQVQLGSPSNHWLAKAISHCQRLRAQASWVSIPTLLLGAELDTIVDTKSIQQFSRHSVHCHYQQIDGAFHELLMEKDPQRSQAIELITAHFEQALAHA